MLRYSVLEQGAGRTRMSLDGSVTHSSPGRSQRWASVLCWTDVGHQADSLPSFSSPLLSSSICPCLAHDRPTTHAPPRPSPFATLAPLSCGCALLLHLILWMSFHRTAELTLGTGDDARTLDERRNQHQRRCCCSSLRCEPEVGLQDRFGCQWWVFWVHSWIGLDGPSEDAAATIAQLRCWREARAREQA